MRLLLLGARGLLGSELVRQLTARSNPPADRSTDLTALDATQCDITDSAAVHWWVERVEPAVIVNCAAYTDVDGCETNPRRAFAVNAEGPRNLARASRIAGALLVHISTDFVFDGGKGVPYTEEDPPNPLSVYGRSKLAGEEAVRQAGGRHLIVRTSWLFGCGGRNFVSTILRKAQRGETLRVVSDQVGSPTYAKDLAGAILEAVEKGLEGTYHLSNAGEATWYELARTALAVAGVDAEVQPITTADWPRPARVPAYSVLSCAKARREAGIVLRHWREALADFVHLDLSLPSS